MRASVGGPAALNSIGLKVVDRQAVDELRGGHLAVVRLQDAGRHLSSR